MKEIELFSHEDILITYSDGKLDIDKLYLKKYEQLIDEINNNKPLTYHKELEPFRTNLKLLLNICKLKDFYLDDIRRWASLIDKVASLATDLGNIKINNKIISEIKSFTFNPRPSETIDIIRFLYIPETIDEFENYLYLAQRLFNAYFFDYVMEKSSEIDTGNEELDNLYKYLLGVNKRIPTKIIYSHETMLSLIYSYLHLNKINNYEMIDEYLNNSDYYKDKAIINDCIPCYKHDYDYDNAKYIFDNLETFLTSDKTKIK